MFPEWVIQFGWRGSFTLTGVGFRRRREHAVVRRDGIDEPLWRMSKIEVVEGSAKGEQASCHPLSTWTDSIGEIHYSKGVNFAPDRKCDSIQIEDVGVLINGFELGVIQNLL